MANIFSTTTISSQVRISCLASSIRKEALPPRIQLFVWLLARNRISSNVTFVRRGIFATDLILCSCCDSEESTIYIVLHCKLAWSFWNLILDSSNVTWVALFSLENFFLQWIGLTSGRHHSIWMLIWFFGIWYLWKVRNNRIFKEESANIQILVFLTVCKAVEYHRTRNQSFPYSVNDVYRSIDFCYSNFYS
ncbi:uncharacterized protein LOC126668639 [Mercurialis annua]|uniref:uncharacterized protein LOC126668639 n=1 Tax=Mercurialis annua TaxID=3986 RepID=UPI00215E19C0|nr:uncharacterized protein LOC126668639 [Mercurialis annua]